MEGLLNIILGRQYNYFTMMEAIRTSQDGMADEVSRNIVAELRRRGTFGGFSEERMQSVLEGIWNKLKYDFKDSQKMACRLEYFSDSKGMQSMFIVRYFKYHFGGVCFIYFLGAMKFLTAFV